MKNWTILLVSVLVLAYFGYIIGGGLILPRCNDNVAYNDCQNIVYRMDLSYRIQGLTYGAIIGLIIGVGLILIIKKFKNRGVLKD